MKRLLQVALALALLAVIGAVAGWAAFYALVLRDLPEINADPAMIRQALLNLALNGLQAMPDGGTLRIACHANGRRVSIDVEDTGVGIPPENLQKIFDLYFTTKEKGSGIGLSMVYRIVQLHDG